MHNLFPTSSSFFNDCSPAKSEDMDMKKMESKTVINSFTCDEGGEFNNNKFLKNFVENMLFTLSKMTHQ